MPESNKSESEGVGGGASEDVLMVLDWERLGEYEGTPVGECAGGGVRSCFEVVDGRVGVLGGNLGPGVSTSKLPNSTFLPGGD